MSVDKLVDSTQLNTDLTSVANAIRAKSGGSSQLAFPSGFVSEIGNIPSGGGSPYEDFSGGNIQAIISSGTQYIQTDYLGSLKCVFSIKFSDNNITGYEGYWSMANGSSAIGIQRNGSSATLTLKFPTSVSAVSYPGYGNGDVIVVTMVTNSSLTATLPLVIFGSYYNGSLENTKGRYTFYGLNIFDTDNNLVKKFVPWLENGVACVKELVSGTIYYNSGTGSFDYIDSQGVTHSA